MPHGRRDLAIVLAGQGVSVFGSQISAVALPLLALELTGSAALAGTLLTATNLAYLGFGIPAGVLADRHDRRVLMIGCELVRMAALITIPVAMVFERLHPAQMYAALIAAACAEVLFSCAMSASLPRLAPPDRLSAAVAASSAVDAGSRVVAPGIAGLILQLGRNAAFGAAIAFVIDAATYGASAVSLGLVRTDLRPVVGPGAPAHPIAALWRDMAGGLAFFWRDRRLRAIAVLVAGSNLFVGAVYLSVVVRARDDLGASPGEIGAMFSVMAGAALVGSWAAGRVTRRYRLGPVLAGSLGCVAIALVVMASAHHLAVLFAGVAVMYVAVPVFNVAQVSYRLSLIPSALQGRVTGAIRSVAVGVSTLATPLGGVLIDRMGSAYHLGVAAAGTLSLVAIVRLGALWTASPATAPSSSRTDRRE